MSNFISSRIGALRRSVRLPLTLGVVAIAATLWATACGDDDPTGAEQGITTVVSLDRTSVTLKTGEQTTLVARPLDAGGQPTGAVVSWSSNNTAVATVTSTGLVSAVSIGTALVTASADGIDAIATVTVQPLGTVIGPAGGTVTSADGNAILEIPANAVAVPTDIAILPASDAMFGSDPTFLPGSGYEIRPAQLQLQEQARLRIRFDPAHLPAGVLQEQLRIRERDRTQNQWRDCDYQGLQNQFVVANMFRLGFYGITVQPLGGTPIGPAGGTVVSADGVVELVIPAGTLLTETDVVIVKLEDDEFSSDPLYVKGTAYEVRPVGALPNKPMQMKIHFDPGNVPAGADVQQLRIRERDRIQNQWRDCSHVGVQQNQVTGNIDRFGAFAVLAASTVTAPVATVTVTPSLITVEEGATLLATAVAKDAAGNVLNVPVTWSSENEVIATVDQTGLVTGVAEGSTTINATAGGVKGGAGVQVNRKVQPATIDVTPTTGSIAIGGTLQLAAVVKDAAGNVLSVTPTWKSSANGVATVSSNGLVTGVAVGSATITATVQSLSATAAITVNPPVSSIVIDDPGGEPLEVGLTKQLTATAYNASGQPIQVTLSWTSSNSNVATVDQTGLVTGVARGTTTITASMGTVSAAVDIKVVGESTEEAGNNMSWPTVFADGIGITGSPVATDPGVRPTIAEGITVDVLPFFFSGNVADYNTYYLQQGANTWRAEVIDGTGQGAYDAEAYWGDNLTAKEWSATKPIRIEVALSATGVGTLKGYNMTYLYGEGPDEMQGTDGSTGDYIPLIYTIGATFTVERLSAQGGSAVATVMSGPIGSEVNVGGRIVYGEQVKISDWTPPSGLTLDGWYRMRFTLPGTSNVMLRSVGNTSGMFLPVVVSPKETMIEVHITP